MLKARHARFSERKGSWCCGGACGCPRSEQSLVCGGRAGKPKGPPTPPRLGPLPAPYSADEPQERCLASSCSSTRPVGGRSGSSRIWGGSLRGPTSGDLSPPCCALMRPQLRVPPDCHLQPGALPSLQTQLLGTGSWKPCEYLKAKVTPTPHLISPSYLPPQKFQNPSPHLLLSQPLLSPLIPMSRPVVSPTSCLRHMPPSLPAASQVLAPTTQSKIPLLPYLVSSTHKPSETPSRCTAMASLANPSSYVTCQAPALMPGQLCQLMSVFDPCSAGPPNPSRHPDLPEACLFPSPACYLPPEP